jgi:HlyD family secretion protein
MMTRTKLILITVTALAIVLVLVLSFRPRPIVVEVARVEREPLLVMMEAEGVTRVVERYVVTAPVSGYARRMAHDVGDAVRAGDVLAVLEPLPATPLDVPTRAAATARVRAAEAAVAGADAGVRQAEQRVAQASAAADLAEREYARIAPLGRDSVVAAAEMDRYAVAAREAAAARADAAAARSAAAAAAAAARHERDAARAVLAAGGSRGGASVAIRAPANGVVLAVHHESEGAVHAGQPLLDIGDPATLEVAAEVLSEDAVRLRPGMRVLVDNWGGPAALEGTVRRIEPVAYTEVSALGVEEQRVLALVDLVSSETDESEVHLGHGYRVLARFVLSEGALVLQAPTSALFREGGTWKTFVVDGGRAQLREVEIGREAGLMAEVLSGLSEGDRVITHPSDDVGDDVRVSAQETGVR